MTACVKPCPVQLEPKGQHLFAGATLEQIAKVFKDIGVLEDDNCSRFVFHDSARKATLAFRIQATALIPIACNGKPYAYLDPQYVVAFNHLILRIDLDLKESKLS